MPENDSDVLADDGDLIVVTPELKIKAAKDQKDHMEIHACVERTYLIVAAVHRDKARNAINRISCSKGVPIAGYVYDASTGQEAYVYECCDYLHLGYIPASFVAKMQGSSWEVRVPMCESVIKKFMSSQQRRELKNFKNHFRPEDYHVEFIQMIDPN